MGIVAFTLTNFNLDWFICYWLLVIRLRCSFCLPSTVLRIPIRVAQPFGLELMAERPQPFDSTEMLPGFASY